MSSTAVEVHHKMQLPQSAEDIKTHIQAIQLVMRDSMIENTHYGKIPGTDKPTLLKAGAEMLLTMFRISLQPKIIDLSTDDMIRYRVEAHGIHMTTGTLIGVGVGECSSSEEKYKWRGASELEWTRTPENRRRIKYGWKWGRAQGEKVDTEVKQVRTNPADQANTVLKMAKKRAEVDLCLTALACSDAFAQDLEEDTEREPAPQQVNPKAQTEAPRAAQAPPAGAPPAGNGLVQAGHIKLLKAKADDAGISDAALLEHVGVEKFEDIPFAKLNGTLEWVAEQKRKLAP